MRPLSSNSFINKIIFRSFPGCCFPNPGFPVDPEDLERPGHLGMLPQMPRAAKAQHLELLRGWSGEEDGSSIVWRLMQGKARLG